MPPMKFLTLEVSSFQLTSDQTLLYLLEEMLLDFHHFVPLLGLPAHSDRLILSLRLRRKLRLRLKPRVRHDSTAPTAIIQEA